MVAGETRQFAVGHSARSVSGGGHQGGSKPGRWPVGGGSVRHGRGNTPEVPRGRGQPPTGRPDGREGGPGE